MRMRMRMRMRMVQPADRIAAISRKTQRKP
jgi:hypothetical protein